MHLYWRRCVQMSLMQKEPATPTGPSQTPAISSSQLPPVCHLTAPDTLNPPSVPKQMQSIQKSIRAERRGGVGRTVLGDQTNQILTHPERVCVQKRAASSKDERPEKRVQTGEENGP